MCFLRGPQETAAQHGREAEGDNSRDQDGNADRNCKFVEKAAQDSTHKQHRNKNRR